jgi:hypothetical protein
MVPMTAVGDTRTWKTTALLTPGASAPRSSPGGSMSGEPSAPGTSGTATPSTVVEPGTYAVCAGSASKIVVVVETTVPALRTVRV